MTGLESDIRDALNRHSGENVSNTPDWILAQYLLSCLAAWNVAINQREVWFGRDPKRNGITTEKSKAILGPSVFNGAALSKSLKVEEK